MLIWTSTSIERAARAIIIIASAVAAAIGVRVGAVRGVAVESRRDEPATQPRDFLARRRLTASLRAATPSARRPRSSKATETQRSAATATRAMITTTATTTTTTTITTDVMTTQSELEVFSRRRLVWIVVNTMTVRASWRTAGGGVARTVREVTTLTTTVTITIPIAETAETSAKAS